MRVLKKLSFRYFSILYQREEKVVEKMTEILHHCTSLYEATAGSVQYDKTYYFSWKWKRTNGKFEIVTAECELKINDKTIKQLNAKEAIRTLGVQMCPQVQWKDQFKVMKEKMIESIAKLNNTEINPYLVHLYFNAYLLKKVFRV